MGKFKPFFKKPSSARTSAKNSTSSGMDMGPPTLLRIPPADTQENSLSGVQYVQTRTVELNQAVLTQHRIIAGNKREPVSRLFDLLRTQVLQKMESNGWRTLAIVSPTPEAGKTFVAINLSISIAQQAHKSALLVDLDLRRPKVATYLGLPVSKSLRDYLDGTASLAQILVNPSIPRLVIAPLLKAIANSAEVLSSKRIQLLLSDLRDRYESRIVVLDMPSILVADDAMVILPHVDCVLLVLGDGRHSEAEIEETLRLIPNKNILGTVLNRVDAPVSNHYYDY